MTAIEAVGWLAIAYSAWAVLNHCLSPMSAYCWLHRWAGARIAARTVFEREMAEAIPQRTANLPLGSSNSN